MEVVIAGMPELKKSSLLPPTTKVTESRSRSSSLAEDSSRSRRNLLTSVRKPLTSDQAVQSNAFNKKVSNNYVIIFMSDTHQNYKIIKKISTL